MLLIHSSSCQSLLRFSFSIAISYICNCILTVSTNQDNEFNKGSNKLLSKGTEVLSFGGNSLVGLDKNRTGYTGICIMDF